MKLNAVIKIQIQQIISHEELKVLTLLYQPLLGTKPYTLYLTLYTLSNLETGISQEFQQKDLLDMLNLKSKEHISCRNKLEALGLLVVFQNGDEYIYSLKSPMTAKEFLNDTIFGSYLQDQIGETQMKNLIAEFRLSQVDLTSYDNITKSFNEVYEIKQVELLNTGNHLRGSGKNNGTKIINDKFNYESFLELIPNRYKRGHLFNPVVKSNLEKIAFIYQFTSEDMYEVYLNSSTKGELPSEEKLRLQASLYYQKIHESSKPEIVLKTDSIADKLDSISPQDIIKMYSKRDNISVDLDTAVAFSQRNDATLGIINAIILYTIKEKEGILPNYTYLEKVLTTWQNNGVKTTEDAVNYLAKLSNSEEALKQKGSSKKSKVAEPDWLDEYIDNF
ncbi:MAG: hypothetical protein GX546_01145 [Acholeplasmataceae bacterium]|jgi:replication initiation and membrane attachment protein|nr:hypothetical protein [Acholeplasmataceae bacterium]